ncbi:MAG TPA: GNAT family N-acetyltransferase [Gammaproteobacteria bacterium]|nr:GNAT family N-acetyltransferase [Gammaproteobacteria bacterium]
MLPHSPPRLLEVRCGNDLVALGLLGSHIATRHGVLRSRQLCLTETGDAHVDALTVEHNGLLIERDYASRVLPAVLSTLARDRRPWDELVVSAIDESSEATYIDAARTTGLIGRVRWRKPSYVVSSADVRAKGSDYLATLSGNSRYQIRRALREYAHCGPVSLTQADDVEQAERFFGEMVEIHQQYWGARGQPGAFGSAFALDFHRALVRARLPHGEVQLLRASAGNELIGYLYNFCFRGTASSYQSGLRYSSDPKLKPGLVSHCLAIQRHLDGGAETYDLLMGRQQYKEMLATRQSQMSWLVLQRPRMRFRVEDALTVVAEKWRARRASTQRANPIQ